MSADLGLHRRCRKIPGRQSRIQVLIVNPGAADHRAFAGAFGWLNCQREAVGRRASLDILT
jgi:hypothetical protein